VGPRPGREPPGPDVKAADDRRIGLGILLIVLVGGIVAVPPAFVAYYSIADGPGVTDPQLALDGWQRVVESSRTLRSIGMSFVLSIRVPIALVVAFFFAWALVRLDLPGRRFLEYSLWFAFFLPILPMTFGWMILAHRNYGLLNEFAQALPFVTEGVFNIQSAVGIIWVHLTLSTIPIMTLLLTPAFNRIDASYEEASEIAGATRLRTLRRISLPLILPAGLTAGLAGLVKSLEAFEVEQILGVPVGLHVYATRIYDLLAFSPPDFKQAMALSTLFLMLLFVVALIYQYVLRSYRGVHTTENRGGRAVLPERTWSTWVISLALYGGIATAIGIPFLVLVLASFNRLFGFFFLSDAWTTQHWVTVLQNPVFLSAARNSLWVGLLVAGLGTLAFSALAWALARARLFGSSVLSLVIWLPWAVPGVLLGTAVLSVFLSVPMLRIFIATLVPLVIALIIQSLPLGTHMLRSSMDQISVEIEEASYLCGVGKVRTFFKIMVPLIFPMFASVFVLMFMSALKDISVTVLLARPGTRTLSLLMFEYAAQGWMEPAAIIGVIMAFAAVVVTFLMFRFTKRLELG
jgi:iron(III) transport system permease protein